MEKVNGWVSMGSRRIAVGQRTDSHGSRRARTAPAKFILTGPKAQLTSLHTPDRSGARHSFGQPTYCEPRSFVRFATTAPSASPTRARTGVEVTGPELTSFPSGSQRLTTDRIYNACMHTATS